MTSSGTLCSKAQASGRPEFLADFRCGDLRKASTLEDVVREGRSLLGSEDVCLGDCFKKEKDDKNLGGGNANIFLFSSRTLGK